MTPMQWTVWLGLLLPVAAAQTLCDGCPRFPKIHLSFGMAWDCIGRQCGHVLQQYCGARILSPGRG